MVGERSRGEALHELRLHWAVVWTGSRDLKRVPPPESGFGGRSRGRAPHCLHLLSSNREKSSLGKPQSKTDYHMLVHISKSLVVSRQSEEIFGCNEEQKIVGMSFSVNNQFNKSLWFLKVSHVVNIMKHAKKENVPSFFFKCEISVCLYFSRWSFLSWFG